VSPRRWFGRLRPHADLDAELREEIETHRLLRQAALERDGLSPADAEAASRRALGNVSLAIEDARDEWTVRAVSAVWRDVRTATRYLWKSPTFTVVAVATLALGIGANAALFTIFSSLLLRQLPVHEPNRLVLLADGPYTYPILEELRRLDADVFAGTLAWSEERFDLSGGGETAPVDGAIVTGNFFEVLGVPAARGRMLTPVDDSPAGEPLVAVISHRLWQERFAGADDVVGRSLTLQRTPFTIVGVMPPRFFGTEVGRYADVMVPVAAEPILRRGESVLHDRSTWWLEVMMRLRPGHSRAAAEAALRGAQPRIRAATMPDWDEGMRANYLRDPFALVAASHGRSALRSRFETPLSAMVIAVGLVLLVACANIASLLLARALSRQRELAVRLALGASRWTIARLLFVESLLLSIVGAGLGLVLAGWWSRQLVSQLANWRANVSLELALDWRVVGFAAGLACLAALVAGVAPVLGVRDIAPGAGIKDGGRGVAGDRRQAVRGTLIVAQIALSLLLVVTAGLFLRTFATLGRIPLGFDPQNRIVAEIDLQPGGIDASQRAALLDRLVDGVRGVSGVSAAAVSAITPVSGRSRNNWIGSSASPPADRRMMTWINSTTPGWFATMGIPLLLGRDFDATDGSGGVAVAIVNQSFAMRFLAGSPPVGQTVTIGGPKGGTSYLVVGLVGDAVYRSPREGLMPTLYLPLSQGPQVPSWVAMTVATGGGARPTVARDVVAALTRVEPRVAVTVRTYGQLLDATVTQERLVAVLSSFFGGLALLLAGIGVYGMVTHAVRTRQSELGVRLALGAGPRAVVQLVLRRTALLIAVGIALGVAGALWAVGFVDTLLFELEARDPATFLGAAAVLAAVGLVSAWVPARRAVRVAPAHLLRER
jgi:putative ABC transport system permease protein